MGLNLSIDGYILGETPVVYEDTPYVSTVTVSDGQGGVLTVTVNFLVNHTINEPAQLLTPYVDIIQYEDTQVSIPLI